jgi:hypothetical protein
MSADKVDVIDGSELMANVICEVRLGHIVFQCYTDFTIETYFDIFL